MLTLYHCIEARSFRVLWTLEELGLRYDLRMLPFPPRVHAREFLTINPLGTIPFFSDGATQMTESAAICQYLVDRYGPTRLAVKSDEAEYGAYLNWIHFGEATLTFPQTIVLRYSRLESRERRLGQAVQDYKRWFLARLRAVDNVVSNQEYLCAGRLTIADISVGFSLLLTHFVGISSDLPLAVQAYWQRLQSTESFQRARRAEEEARVAQGIAKTTLLPL
jgi:glutathione S-transferase